MRQACPGGSTGPSRASLRQPRERRCAPRGSLPWTTWTSPSSPQGGQFLLSPGDQFRVSLDTMRQNIQLDLAFPPTARGEARSSGAAGIEARAARVATESPAAGGPSMEAIVERDNLRKALAQVRRNKGAPGVDGMTVDDLASHLKDHWPEIKARLLAGTYKPQPVRAGRDTEGIGRHAVARHPDGTRPFHPAGGAAGAASGLGPDLLRAQPRLPPWPLGAGSGARGANLHCRRRPHVVDIDLEKFFDRVNHDVLMGWWPSGGRSAHPEADPRLLDRGRDGGRVGRPDGRGDAARWTALAAVVEPDARWAGPGTGTARPPLRTLCRRLQHLCAQSPVPANG